MKVEKKNLPDSRVELTVTLDETEIPRYEKRAIDTLAKDLKLSGFRQGKVPADIAIKHLDPRAIAEKSIDLAVRATLVDAFKEVKVQPIQMPSVNVADKGYEVAKKLVYIATADVVPPIKLGDYKKLKIEKIDTSVSNKDVDDVLDRIATGYGEKSVVKRAAKMGDEIVLDFTGSVDGVEFPGGKAHDFTLLLGSGQFIPGFEEGCVGHSAGDRFDLPVTFPKEYHAENLAGKKASFNILIKQVTELKKAAVDDELAKKCGFTDLKSLRQDVKQNLENQNKARARAEMRDKIAGALVESSKVEAPNILVKDQYNQLLARHTQNAESRGVSLDDWLKMQNVDRKEWEKELMGIAEDHVKAQLCIGAVFEQENVKVPDEAVEGQINAILEVYKKAPEVKKMKRDANFRAQIRHQMEMDATLDHLLEINHAL